MVEGRDTMIGMGVGAEALGGEERSDEAARAPVSERNRVRDPEVVAKPTRRQFTAEYKFRILEETDRCSEPGEVGRIVRREGLYSSHLTAWRKARREGSLKGLTPKRRGRKPARRNSLQKRVDELEAEVARLEKQLATAETILEVQGKVAGLLGLSFDSGKNS